MSQEPWDNPWKWDTLVHVCRKWRNIVFASPRRLDLRLLCTHKTPVKRILEYWPPFPIVIKYWATLEFRPPSLEDEDNVVAALEYPDRIRGVRLAVTSSLLGKVATLMQVPFPALTSLSLWWDNGLSQAAAPLLPNALLGGLAPCLRDLSLIGIPFPNLPGLLSSTRSLASLRLLEVPETGYIAPRVMAACLSALADLKVLCIEFHSPTSRPDRERRFPPPPPNRVTLPTLTRFNFRGSSEYLEDLLARIDAPFLSHVDITFFNQLIFQVPHLSHFIGRIEMLQSANVAEMESSLGNGVSIKLEGNSGASATPGTFGYPLSLCVSCGELDWQISSMAQICSQSPLFSGVEHLDIRADYLHLGYLWQDDEMDSHAWLELFRSFTSVKTLSISGELGPHVAPALEVVATTVTEVLLPGLRMLHFECSRKSAPVENFVEARLKSNLPVDVLHRPFPSWEVLDDASDTRSAVSV